MNNTTQSLQQDAQNCPYCDSEDLNSDLDHVAATCQQCGAVIDSFEAQPTDDGSLIDASAFEQSELEDWSEYAAVTNSTEQQVADALSTLDTASSELEFPVEVRRRAVQLYADVAKAALGTGRNLKKLVGACLFIGAREEGYACPAGSVSKAVEIEQDDVHRYTRLIYRELDLEYTDIGPMGYVTFLCEQFECNSETEEHMRHLLSEATSGGLHGGCNPAGFAAAAMYFATSGITQQTIATAAGVNRETIRVRCADLSEFVEEGQ